MEEKKDVYGFGLFVDGSEDWKKFKEIIEPGLDDEMKARIDANYDDFGDKMRWVSIVNFTEDELFEDGENCHSNIEDIRKCWEIIKPALDAGYHMSLFKF